MSKEDGRFSTVIRVDLRERFFDESKPGRLVNDLLEAHYGTATPDEPETLAGGYTRVKDPATGFNTIVPPTQTPKQEMGELEGDGYIYEPDSF